MSQPTKFKTGRRSPKNAPALELSRFLTGVIPVHPASENYGLDFTGWQMLGNDQYGDCITPEVRVLRSDLQWIPAGDLAVGDKLIAFDEDARPAAVLDVKSPGRYYKSAVVECVDRVIRPCYELEFDDGTIVRASEGHRWLVGSLSNGAKWAETRHLKAGGRNASSVGKPFNPWETENTWEAGYLAAAWNGEGNLDLSGVSMRLVFSQVDNVMLAEVEHALKSLDIDYTHSVDRRSARYDSRQDVHRVSVGKREHFLRALGMVRPARLLPKLSTDNLGRMDRVNIARLIRKTHIGDQEVVMLNTSSRTYFAEGLASHNCVAVTWANQRALVTTALTGTTAYPSQDEVFAFYKTQNPNFPSEDNGMDIQTALEYLVSTGGSDKVKALAFAKVDYTNLDELQAAHAIFGQVWYGINVYDENQTEFGNGQEWTYESSFTLDGGHSVAGVGYDAADTDFITWAKETDWNDTFRRNAVEEAWVVIWPEHLGSKAFLAGVDQAALAADFHELTGGTFPVTPTPEPTPQPTPTPTPAPAPTPQPTPTPTPVPPAPVPPVDPNVEADQAFIEIADRWHQHPHNWTEQVDMERAYEAWKKARGYA